MGIFDIFRTVDINAGVEEFRNTAGAVLLDVRTRDEFASGHISGAVNIPLQEIRKAESKLKNKTAPVFTYCLSGARSSQATSVLKDMGFENVKNIGGIGSYRGRIVK